MESLFSHFAQRTGTPERCATDALCFILQRSVVAREALRAFINMQGIHLPERLHFENQVVCGDGCIPDVVGFDGQSQRVLILDGKFWAPLTDRQPVAYLQTLVPDESSLLAFVAPAVRAPKLWNELLLRCRESSINVQPSSTPQDAEGSYIGFIEGTATAIAVFSWRQVLHSLHEALKEVGESAVAADAQQLQALCEAMDETAFLPLRAEELDPSYGLRLHQFGLLIDRIFEALEIAKTPWLSSPGRWDSGPGSYGRNLQMHGIAAWFGLSGEHWATMRSTPEIATPLWIEFYADRTQIRRLRQQLRQLPYDEETKLRSFEDPEVGPNISVAIDLPVGGDEQRVIKSVVQQLNEIAALVGTTE